MVFCYGGLLIASRSVQYKLKNLGPKIIVEDQWRDYLFIIYIYEIQMLLKRETQGAFCVANAKSQARKYIKINVICIVYSHIQLCDQLLCSMVPTLRALGFFKAVIKHRIKN